MGIIIFLSAYGLASVLGAMLLCVPTHALWNNKGRCMPMDRNSFWFFNAALNIIMDVSFLILPMPLIKRLQIQRPHKLGLMVLFSIGLL